MLVRSIVCILFLFLSSFSVGGNAIYDELENKGTYVEKELAYCIPSSTLPWNDYITGVTLGTINNDPQVYVKSDNSPPIGVGDYTNLSTDLTIGNSEIITVDIQFSEYVLGTGFFTLWIDLNGDQDFDDAGEMLLNNTYPLLNTDPNIVNVSQNISIPATATSGATRMRLIVKRDNVPTPCESGFLGEVEDYTVNLIAGTPDTTPPTPTLSGPTTTTGIFDVNIVFDEAVTAAPLVSDFAIINGTVNNVIDLGTGVDFTANITPINLGNINLSLNANAVQDAAGNGNVVSNVHVCNYSTSGPPPTGYCASSGQSWREWIAQVTFSNIDNSSAGQPYSDYTHLTADVVKGGVYPITFYRGVRVATFNPNLTWRVWIDHNRDGDFDDAGELLHSLSSRNYPFYRSIQIDPNASTGLTRMRISAKRPGGAGPCDVGGFGEVEDYMVNIMEPGPNLNLALTGANPSSPILSDGSVLPTITGGTPPYYFIWSNGETSRDLHNLPTGYYSLTVTDNVGTTATDNVELEFPVDPLVISLTATNASGPLASDGGVTSLITGGWGPYEYEWNNGTTTANLTNVAPGLYAVTVTDALDNVLMDQVTVSVGTTPITLSGVVTDESGLGAADGAIDLTVSGGTSPYLFMWNNGGITEDLNNVHGGDYEVTVSDNYGITSTALYTIQTLNSGGPAMVVNHIVIPASGNSIRDGAIDLTVFGGTAPYTFAWDNGATTEDLVMLAPGTYVVTVTDAVAETETLTISLLAESIFPQGVFHQLVKKLDGGFVLTNTQDIRFKYLEKYSPEVGHKLSYKIVTKTGTVNPTASQNLINITSNTANHEYGVNFYKVDLETLNLADNEIYTLVVENGNKDETHFLRFRIQCAVECIVGPN